MTSARESAVRILLVENDPADAELAISELERSGLEVSHDVVDSPDALERKLDQETYDLVLADYRLGSWTGMDALGVLQRRRLDVPLILVTGTLGEERAVECLKAGATDCVFKRNLSGLPHAVRRALEEGRTRRAHQEAQEVIRKLSLAVDQGPAAVFITDPGGTIEYVNRRFTEITGFTSDEAIGANPRILSSGRTPPETYAHMWEAIKAGRVWRSEIQNRRKDGTVYWDAVAISPIRDPDGGITHFLAIQEDITERRWAENAIREREERFRQIAENIKELFFIVESDFRQTVYVSPAYETIWGRTCESAYEDPNSFMDGVAPEHRASLITSIERIKAGEGPQETEFRVARPDGSERWVLSHAVPILDDHGRIYRISGVALDITDRRAAQERLLTSEDRFRKLGEASFDAISFVENGVIREVNAGFEKMFGCTAQEAVGRPAVDFIAEESRAEASARIATDQEGRYELVGQRTDGTKLLLEVTAKTHDISGRLERITALRDITQIRALEDQFRQAQKMEAVGRLAGGVAHDFNNLLTVITTYADLILADILPDDPAREDVEEIRQAAEHAAGLTHQLLAFSRRQVIEPRLVLLEDVVREAGKMLKRVIGEDIEFTSVLSEDAHPVLIDPGQLHQVIMNLAVNARDAMPQGGHLTIETAAVELNDDYVRGHWPAEPGRFVMMAVSDTGTGMDEETRARIFEPFFTTKEAGKGTGLGLASVYGIVKQAKGFVWVYSEPGRGATFKIYLPEVEGTLNDEVTAEDGLDRSGTETVLLAEDVAAVRTAARQTLERSGYAVLEAPTPRVALHLARSHPGAVHLLLTDVVMPKMGGPELAKAFSALRPSARVIYMSGYTDDAVVRHGLVEAGIHYLQKPFSADDLLRKVRAVLDAPADSAPDAG